MNIDCKVETFNNIEEVKNAWLKIEKDDNDFTIFQTYRWNYLLYNNEKKRNKKIKILFTKFIFLEGIIIAPLIICEKEKEIKILGNDNSSDYLNLIYSKNIVNKISEVINYLKTVYFQYKIFFSKIYEEFLSNEMFDSLQISHYTTNCGKITVNDSYFEKLSKNSRQNYRTANNRLIKDNLKFSYEILNHKINLNMAKKFYIDYKLRRIDKSNVSMLFKNIYKIKNFFNCNIKLDLLSQYLLNYDDSVILAGYIDNKLAAYFCGVKYKNNLYVCRASTNQKYYKYSPGVVLLINIIKQNELGIKYYDLTRGDEKYKFQCGAQLYNNHNYTL